MITPSSITPSSITEWAATQRAILIAGPTASGKSALAMALAERHCGVVINADSMQVYADLEILTARPSPADLRRCPHVLYGHVDGADAYSVGRWVVDTKEALEAAWQRGAKPIVVGGTGLYFKALLDGLSPIPAVPEAVREHWRGKAKRLGAEALHAVLAARDPMTAARLAASDGQRTTRALEVLEATGRGLADWQREPGQPVLAGSEALLLVAAPEREALYMRADRRFDAMMAGEAMAEVAQLAERGYAADRPVMGALGVAPLLSAMKRECSLDQAVEQAKRDTRHYIKRQQTWLRRNMIAWNHVSTQEMVEISAQSFTLIQ